MARGDWNKRPSRCCDERDIPLTWRDYIDRSHPSVSEFDGWLDGLAPFARAIELAEIEALMEAASRGRLWNSGDASTPIKPIRENPEVFELRRKALNKALRFYHAEPPELPLELIALHRHIKTNGCGQQTEIEYAASRYMRGAENGWVQK